VAESRHVGKRPAAYADLHATSEAGRGPQGRHPA